MYPYFMGKVSTWACFPFELCCKDYTLFDQAVKECEHGLDSILMDSVKTLELDASFG